MELAHRKVTYRLYPSKVQAEALLRDLRLHQQLYNAALEQRISAWRRCGVSVRFADQCKDLTALRTEFPEFRALNAQSAQVTLKRLDLAFQAFFRRVKAGDRPGFPRFKAFDRFSGWGYKTHGDGFRVQAGEGMRHGRIRISGVGSVRMRGQARTPGEPVTGEILHKAGKWYASVTVACAPQRSCGHRAAGLDWGVESFATLAFQDGTMETVENPRVLRRSEARLRSAQKAVSRKRRGSRNRERAKAVLAACHEKVANQRKDFLHQVSARLVGRLALIATESLRVTGMTASGKGTVEKPGRNVKQKAGLNRAILDTAPAAFLQMLRTKAEEAGCVWVEIPTKEVKPSQTCARCGHQAKKRLSQRVHRCEACGHEASRDHNAAEVMLIWALKALAGREPSGCGGVA